MSDTRSNSAAPNAHGTSLWWAGVGLLAGGLLWQPLLAFQNLADLHKRSTTWQWYLDQWGFLIAMMCLLLGLVALDRTRVTGEGRLGRGAMHVLVLAWGALVLSQLVKLALGLDLGVVGIVGSLLTYPAALVAGFAVLRAGRWSGWRRWTLLGEGVYETLVILVPLLVANWGPSWATEAGWQLSWVLVGAAALTEARNGDRLAAREPAGARMMRS